MSSHEFDLTALIPRLERLKTTTSRGCSLDMVIWCHTLRSHPVIEWTVWDGQEHYRGVTPDQAMQVAEAAHDITFPPIPERLIVPHFIEASEEADVEADRQLDEGRLYPKEWPYK